MPANTHGADINELALGFFLNKGKWFSPEAEAQFKLKKKLVSAEELAAQMGRAQAMAEAVLAYCGEHYKSTTVKRVFWTARPGSLEDACKVCAGGKKNWSGEIDQRKNPTDILIQLGNGTVLGLSAKSTQGSSDIGFKNPGMGTVESSLKIKLQPILEGYVAKAVKQFKLSTSAATRKQEIRAKAPVQAATQAMGEQALSAVRDALFARLKKMSQTELRSYLLSSWMDANTGLYPPYVKVTGMGKTMPFTAKVEDPLSNPKLKAVKSTTLALEKNGVSAIGVTAGGKRILKMRAKFESEKLASPIKFSGEPF